MRRRHWLIPFFQNPFIAFYHPCPKKTLKKASLMLVKLKQKGNCGIKNYSRMPNPDSCRSLYCPLKDLVTLLLMTSLFLPFFNFKVSSIGTASYPGASLFVDRLLSLRSKRFRAVSGKEGRGTRARSSDCGDRSVF